MILRIRKYIRYVVPVLGLFLYFNYVFSIAAVLQLKKIGLLNVEGKNYSEWWYTGTRPTLYGAAEANSTVNIKIGETSSSASADASGEWSHATQIDTGDYAIEISQGSEKISFTLHVGQNVPSNIGSSEAGETTQSANGVPETGFNQYVAITSGFGIILLATYFYFSTDSKRKTVFETRVLKED